ncbi:MAG: glycoside hydrolase TIM-barrel-like domain-containing protein [Methylocella sp.]
MGFVNGVNLLPSTGEFTYGTTPRLGQRVSEFALVPINTYNDSAPFTGVFPKTDYSYSIDQLQAAFPACTTVAVVCAWFGNSIDASLCQIYPSTTYIDNGTVANPSGGFWPAITPSFQFWNGSAWQTDHWMVSSLTETSSGLIPISSSGGSFTYGGTPSDQSIVECIGDLRARGFRVVFYPFILMDSAGKPWRGRITYSPDVSPAAASAVAAFLGSATPSQFTRDYVNNTVSYAGSPTDFTYRRMVLHYANLCIVAGGVDLFLIGSEFRGLETIRGPEWTITGMTDGGGKAIWDYPFVAGMITLADVRSVLDTAGFTKDLTGLHNLIAYAADWSDWMGWQHPGASPALPVADGQWPHLDQLWAHSNIDLVCFDNYMPLSDWTTGDGSLLPSGQSNNLDVANWSAPAALDSAFDYELVTQSVVSTADYGAVSLAASSSFDYGIVTAAPAWPPPPSTMSNLGLAGQATINSLAYLKANIEGGEKFNWFYFDSNNLGRGTDPLGSDQQVSIPGYPADDRLLQSRNQYFANQQVLGNKQIRWWWNNPHFALYDDGDGLGDAPKGPQTEWIASSKSIAFTEYGFPACDKCPNQPNVFFDARSTESATPFWSIWHNVDGGGFLPLANQNLQILALQAIYEYWFVDGHNATSGSGAPMIQPVFCSVWNWDARPFPVFPQLSGVWGDAGNWQAGNWLNGKGPFLTPPVPDPPPAPGVYPPFPVLRGLGWSIHYAPAFATGTHEHVSGRESRFLRMATAVWEIELTVDLLTMDVITDFQTLVGFYEMAHAQDLPFTYAIDPALGIGSPVNCRFADDFEDLEEFVSRLWQVQAVKLRTVKSE